MRSRRRIDASLNSAVRYLYLLHKSGASLSEAVDSLARHAEYFGDAAAEFRQAAADIRLGCSISEALDRLAAETPSKKLRQFLSGYTAAVKTTGSAVSYLEDTVSSNSEEEISAQERYLQNLGVFAEIYLILFSAGPLFAVIAGMVLGMISAADTDALAALIYLVLPLGTAAFLLALDSLDNTVSIRHKEFVEPKIFAAYQKAGDEEDSGLKKPRKRREAGENPFRHLRNSPESILYLSLPAGILFSMPLTDFPYLWTAVFLLTVFVPFAVCLFLHDRWIREAERAVPEFFRRVSGAVSAGDAVSSALRKAAAEERSVIKPEVCEMAAGIVWGKTVSEVFIQFASRMKLISVDRMVIQAQECTVYSDNPAFAFVLTASEEKRRVLEKERRQSSMAVYTAVLYLAYAVFLFVSCIMLTVFLETMASASFASAGYETLVVHAVLIHGVCSGLAAGKMGEGSVFAGIKHACVMFAAGMLVFSVIGAV